MSDKNIDDQNFENQPSDYDETYEDDVTYTEDDSEQWSDDADLGDDDESTSDQPAPKKKKTSNLTIAIIMVVAVVGVLGFMVLKGSKNTAPQPTAENQSTAPINADEAMTAPSAEDDQTNTTDLKNQADQAGQGDQTANVQPPTPAPTVAEPQQGLMDNPNLMGSNENTQVAAGATDALPDVAPTPATMPTTTPATTNVELDAVAPSQDVVNTISPTVKPVSDFPTVDSIKKPDVAPTPDLAGSAAPDAVTTITDKSNNLDELQAKIDAAQSKISALEKKISDQAAELEAQKQAAAKAIAQEPVTSSGASDAEVAALKEHISELEEKLAAKTEESPKPVVMERAPAEEKDYIVSKPVVKKTAVAAKPILKQIWSLKSAGTGKAILSDRATGDLKTVRVGDVVSGLGRIVSISNSNSSWVVKGTLASVSE